jgi:putative ABC transport system permease protein
MNLTTKIAFREIVGGWKGLIVFYLCVIISATVLIVIDEISANLEGNFQQKAKEILGGDIEFITANFKMSKEELRELSKFGAISEVADLRAMVSFNETNKLVELKSIDETYPLYGEIDADLSELLKTDGILIAEELKINLGVAIGDEIDLAGLPLKVLGVVGAEPDWLASSFVLGSRVLVSNKTLQKTELIKPGSLIRYKYRLAIKNGASTDYVKTSMKEAFPNASWIVRDYKEGNTTFVNSIERLEFFLMLAGISNLLICGVGIAAAAKFFMEKKLPNIAILKSCGATKKSVIATYMKLIIMISFDAFLTASILSALITYFVLPILNEYLPFSVDFSFYWQPILKSMIFVFLTVITFTLPVILNAVEISPATLFRGVYFFEFNHTRAKTIIYIISLLLLSGILLIYSDNVKFLAGYLLAAGLTFYIYLYSGKIFKKALKRIVVSSSIFRLAIGNITRPGSSLSTIMLSIGISLTVFIILATTQYNISARLNDTIPQKAPSLFLIDAQENQLKGLKNLIESTATNIIIKPSVQGAITHLNGKPIDEIKIDKESEWAVRSHRRLSYAAHMPELVTVSKGKWWDASYNGKPLVSLDEGLSDGLNVGIGDEITFNIMGKVIEAEIANLRKVDYSSFNINFAVIFSGGVLDQFPKSYFVTLKVSDLNKEYELIKDISEAFPNIVSVRTSDGINTAKKYIGDIVAAIEVIVIISLLSGLIVLAGSFLAHQEKRKYDIVVLKVLGASSFDIYKTLIFEAAILATLSGMISIVIGNLGAYSILSYLKFEEFNFSLLQNLWMFLGTIIVVISVILMSSYRIFNIKPIQVLRNE